MRPFQVATASMSLIATLTLAAQEPSSRSTHDTRTPISIGNYPNVTGLRLNFRDSDLERVTGMNVTIWSPYEPATGVVKGVALGLPVTGAGDIVGLGAGVFGVGAAHNLSGLMIGPVGAGAGGRVSGIAIGGIGVGAGGNLRGIIVGGVGVGAGGNFKGVALGGVGVGAGGNATGLMIGGVGVGAGGTLRGIGLGGVGVGAPRIEGGFVALAVGAQDARAIVIAPAFFKIGKDGTFRGAAVSAVNYIKGSQSGLTIGLVNYARNVSGVQIGLINVIANQRGHPVLPIVNWGSR